MNSMENSPGCEGHIVSNSVAMDKPIAKHCSCVPAVLLLLLISACVHAQEVQDYSRCDPHLGSNYDSGSAVDRTVRQNKYFACVTQQIYVRLQAGLRQKLIELNQWKARNNRTARRSVKTRGQDVRAELKALHDAQSAELNTDRAQMNARHRKERWGAANTIRQCFRAVDGVLDGKWNDAYQDLTGQYQTKTLSVRTSVAQIRSTPFNRSVNEYLSSKSEPLALLGDTSPPPPPAADDIVGVSQSTEDATDDFTAEEGALVPPDDSIEAVPEEDCEIIFVDGTEIAADESQIVSLDQHGFDCATEDGTSRFSPLRGLFIYANGLIDGDEEVDEVKIRYGNVGGRG